MKHEYDDETIFKAMVKASDEYPGIRGMISAPFEAFLDALPDQPDEWQECNYEDIKGTDQKARAVYDGGVIMEGPVQEIYVSTVVLVGEHRLPRLQAAKYYRIPAPVQHPDPDEHEVICVFKTTTHDYMTSEGRQEVMWTGEYYENSEHRFAPEKIADWSPAKVVIADE